MSSNEQRDSSVTSDDAPVTERTNSNTSSTVLTSGAKSPKFDFFQKRRSVAPTSVAMVEDDADVNAPETLLFLNQTTELDFRSLFRRTSSVGVVSPTGATSPAAHKEKRRLRQREELCLMTAKTQTRAKKAWFLSHGYIGRDNGEHILVSTKDASMDPIHAEVLLDDDDYLIRDHNSSSGSYLCLTTINRHHPQRDGFRLRNGDSFMLGTNVKVIVHELITAPKRTAKAGEEEVDLKLRLERRSTGSSSTTAETESETSTASNSMACPRRVRFGEALNAFDGSPIVGNRYKRKKKKALSPYEPQIPVSLSISVLVDEQQVNQELQLPGKDLYLIGSSPVCDIQIPSTATTGIHAVHARIVFDSVFFVLQDLSFEDNPKKRTRVSLQQPTRIGRGDCLLFGACVLYVVNVYRAFRDHEPDMKEVAFKCHLLRPSKRKSRSKEKYIPFGFRHHTQDPFVFGKGRHCEGHIFTSALNVEQFAIQLDHGACSLVPRAAGINQGMYFLLGRNCMPHDQTYRADFVRYTSKALMLVEGSVFKCGNTELEVVYVKKETQSDAAARADEVRENAYFLSHMPWIQQIALDRHGIENVAKRGQRLELQPGDTIYDDGDPATFLFIVITGQVELVSRRSELPSSWRLSAIEGFLSPSLDSSTPLPGPVTEHVSKGSFFGEVCLCGAGLEYGENAKVASPCVLLAISREDLCGYLSHYMDIITPHLAYESHKEVLQKLRLNVAWLREYSYQDLRVLASKAEHVCFEQGESLIEDGLFQINNTQRSGGLLLLGYGKAQLMGKVDPTTSDQTDDNDSDEKVSTLQELWKASQPIVCSAAVPLDPSFHNIKARSRVECFFFDSTHVAHLIKQEQDASGQVSGEVISALPSQLRQDSTARRSSFVSLQQRARHSQIVMTSANSADEEDANLDGSEDVEEINDPAQKWRRKKRNKTLLEKTVLETQQNGDLVNALVIYVLSGANRGDIHVVRNLASVGGILSDADIELNDRYVSRHQAVIQHRESRFWLYDNASEWGTYVRLEENQNIQVYPGDVFISGEVEFTCLAAFPVRKKTQICCIQ